MPQPSNPPEAPALGPPVQLATPEAATSLAVGPRSRWELPPFFLALLLVAVLASANAFLQPSFATPGIFKSNIQTFLPLILIAVGQTYVVLGGSIDLSLGALVSLINVIVVAMLNGEDTTALQLFAGIAVALLVGAGGGLLNGLLLGLMRLQPIVTTFATSVLFGGIALWIMPQAGGMMPSSYYMAYASEIAGFNVAVIALLLACLVAYLLSRTKFQTYLKAVGSNRLAAFQAGLPVLKVRIASHVVAGLFAALATLCILGETGAGDPLMGQAFTLGSVSAVVLGGTALAGGSGSVVGTVLGAIALGLINNVLFFAQLDFIYQSIVQGTIILLALAGGVLVARR